MAPVQLFRTFMEERLPQVVRCGPSLVSTYLGLLPGQSANIYWPQVLNTVISLSTREALDWLDEFNGISVPLYLQPSQVFEAFIKRIILVALDDRTNNLKQALSLLERSGLCLRVYCQSPLADSGY